MKPSKPEVREVVELLDQEYEDVVTLAEAVLTKSYELYEQKFECGILFQQDDHYLVVRGFSTVGLAQKWAAKQGLKPEEAVLAVVKVEGEV